MGDGVTPPAGFGVGQAVQPLHGDLRRTLPPPHEDLGDDADARSPRCRPRTISTRCTTPIRSSGSRTPSNEILAAPPITFPLTLPMCAPLSDGAAAVIVCTEEGLRAHRRRPGPLCADRGERHAQLLRSRPGPARPSRRPTGGADGLRDGWARTRRHARRRGARRHRDGRDHPDREPRSGRPGTRRRLRRAGDFTIGGRIPVNPSGGLESKGHPIGATGLGQLYELVTQLRGEAEDRQVAGARHAIQENGGGFLGIEEAAVAIHILTRRTEEEPCPC